MGRNVLFRHVSGTFGSTLRYHLTFTANEVGPVRARAGSNRPITYRQHVHLGVLLYPLQLSCWRKLWKASFALRGLWCHPGLCEYDSEDLTSWQTSCAARFKSDLRRHMLTALRPEAALTPVSLRLAPIELIDWPGALAT
jgi:hypothetical protein